MKKFFETKFFCKNIVKSLLICLVCWISITVFYTILWASILQSNPELSESFKANSNSSRNGNEKKVKSDLEYIPYALTFSTQPHFFSDCFTVDNAVTKFVASTQIYAFLFLNGLFFTLLYQGLFSKTHITSLKFENEILIEEVKQASSKKIFVLHFKIYNLSKEIMSNMEVFCRIVWPENEVNIDLKLQEKDEESYLMSHQSTENVPSNGSFSQQLELSYDRLGPVQKKFYIFIWPTVLYHKVLPGTPLWDIRKLLSKKDCPTFKVEIILKGFRTSLSELFTEKYSYNQNDINFTDELITHVIFNRELDSDGDFKIKH